MPSGYGADFPCVRTEARPAAERLQAGRQAFCACAPCRAAAMDFFPDRRAILPRRYAVPAGIPAPEPDACHGSWQTDGARREDGPEASGSASAARGLRGEASRLPDTACRNAMAASGAGGLPLHGGKRLNGGRGFPGRTAVRRLLNIPERFHSRSRQPCLTCRRAFLGYASGAGKPAAGQKRRKAA